MSGQRQSGSQKLPGLSGMHISCRGNGTMCWAKPDPVRALTQVSQPRKEKTPQPTSHAWGPQGEGRGQGGTCAGGQPSCHLDLTRQVCLVPNREGRFHLPKIRHQHRVLTSGPRHCGRDPPSTRTAFSATHARCFYSSQWLFLELKNLSKVVQSLTKRICVLPASPTPQSKNS